MFDYKKIVKEYEDLKNQNPNIYKNINPVSAARMRLQNRFHTGLDIAQYTADIMHADMADYDKDSSNYTQSLGCLLYTSPSPRDQRGSRMPSSA